MSATNSSIPTTLCEGFDLQDLPHRASTLREETLSATFLVVVNSLVFLAHAIQIVARVRV